MGYPLLKVRSLNIKNFQLTRKKNHKTHDNLKLNTCNTTNDFTLKALVPRPEKGRSVVFVVRSYPNYLTCRKYDMGGTPFFKTFYQSSLAKIIKNHLTSLKIYTFYSMKLYQSASQISRKDTSLTFLFKCNIQSCNTVPHVTSSAKTERKLTCHSSTTVKRFPTNFQN